MDGKAIDDHIESHVLEGGKGLSHKLSDYDQMGIKRKHSDVEGIKQTLSKHHIDQRRLNPKPIDHPSHKER